MGEIKLNRTRYYNYIEEKLNFLAYRIEKRGKINLLDLNIHSETFFAELFNILYDYNLVNLNYYTSFSYLYKGKNRKFFK